jgi:hypothetical protein
LNLLAQSDDVPADKLTAPSSTSGTSHKVLKLGGCAFVAVVALVAIILGGVFPTIVDTQIQAAVYKTIRLDPQAMEAESLAKYMNSSQPTEYYLYTITNLKSALTTGEKLNFKEVGPIYMRKYTYKVRRHVTRVGTLQRRLIRC